MLSTHKVEVVPVVLEKHPNADSLSIVKVFGYQVVVRTKDWIGRDIGAYIPPDSIVPDNNEFAFLEGKRRIKTRKFRGIMSQGLLWPIINLEGKWKIGDDTAEFLGITHYEPPVEIYLGGNTERGPHGGNHSVVYDVESWYRYPNTFKEGDNIIVSEKVHGANGRFVFSENRMWAGSRREWKKPDDNVVWWQVLKQNPWIEEWCRTFPEHYLYGEVYGWVQELRYGKKKGEFGFAVFDIMLLNGNWIDGYDLHLNNLCGAGEENCLKKVPLLYCGPYTESKIRSLISGPSLLSTVNQIREGIVIRPYYEEWDERIGRKQVKAVSDEYLEKSK